ncbi:MAG TPA: hypothetical protein VJ418_33910 [Streptosporangiaceae bacterium]|nr:hypothetical protein [Streptosporangiaceae bacterium]
MPLTPKRPAQVEAVVAPCSAHRAIQRSGITWTTSRRRHCGQYRGGSSSSRRTQVSCPVSAAASPQCPQ